MIHVRMTHRELGLLRKKSIRSVNVPKGEGARRPQLDQAVIAYAPALRDEGGEVVKKREQLRCIIITVVDEPGRWVCEYLPGATEQHRYLTARPGKRGDYTTDERYAMKDEPEAIPESAEREVLRRSVALEDPRSRRYKRVRPDAA